MDKYVKVKPLGKGSFGAALLIKRKSDGQLLVVKEVNMAKMNAKEREEARNECRILQQLSHPNIVRYYEHMERNGVLYIIMEYADGGDLHSKMKRHPGGLPEDVSLHYFAQICLAMDYLHSRHILHRDIKTMNVFLTSSGAVKLGDFGIATVLRNTMGLANTVCGTPYYFSPELCKNKPYNNRSDVWAMGVVLYELATGKHAFDGNSMQQLMQRILKTNAPPLPTTFSRDFRAMLDSCLQKDPLRRPNIKQLLTIEPVRSALVKLEQALMLATQCKVRLKDIVGSGSGSGCELRSLESPRSSPSPPSAAAVTAAAHNNNNINNIAKKTPQQFLAEALASPSPQIKPVIALHNNNNNAPARKPSVSPSRAADLPPVLPNKSPGLGPAQQPPLGAKPVSPVPSAPISPKLGHVNAFIHELERPLEEHAREAIRAFMKRKEEEAAEARRKEAAALKELEEKKLEMLRVMAEHQQRMREAAKLRQQKALEQQQQQVLADQQQIQRLREQSAQRAAALQQQQMAAANQVDPRPTRKPPQVLGELGQQLEHAYQHYVPGSPQPAGYDVTPRRKKSSKKTIAANSPRHAPGRGAPLPSQDEAGRGPSRRRSESPHPTPPVDVAKASNWVEKQAQERRNQKKLAAENLVEAERKAVRLLGDNGPQQPIYQDDHSKVIPTRVVDPELDAWVRRQQNARRNPASCEPAAGPPCPPSGHHARVLSDDLPAGVEARRMLRAGSEPAGITSAPVLPLPAAFQSENIKAARKEPRLQPQQPATARSYDPSSSNASASGADARSLTPPLSSKQPSVAVLRDVERGIPRMDSLTGRDRAMQELDQSPPTGLATQHYRPILPGLGGGAGRRLPLEPLSAGEGAAFGNPTGSIHGVEALDLDDPSVPEEELGEQTGEGEEAKSTYEDMLAHLKHVLEAKSRKSSGHSSRHLAAISDIQTPAAAKTRNNDESELTPRTPPAVTAGASPPVPFVALTPEGAPDAPVHALRSRRTLGIAPLAHDIICTEDVMGADGDDDDVSEDDDEDFADEVPITPFRNAKKKQQLPPAECDEERPADGDGGGSSSGGSNAGGDSSGYFEDDDDHDAAAPDVEEETLPAVSPGDKSPQQLDEETQFAHYLAQFCGDHFAGTVPVLLDGTPLFNTATAGLVGQRAGGPQQGQNRQKSLTYRLREYIVSKIGRTATERSILSLLGLKTASSPSSPGSPGSSPVHHIKNLIISSLHHRSGQGRTTTSDGLLELRREADEVFSLCAQLLFLEEEGI
jgi:serine/threonine protein kinase